MLGAFPEGVCWMLDLVPPPWLASVPWAQRRKRRALCLPYMGRVTGAYFLTSLRPLKEYTFRCSRMKLKWSPHLRAQHESLYLVTQEWQEDRRMGWGSCGNLGTTWKPPCGSGPLIYSIWLVRKNLELMLKSDPSLTRRSGCSPWSHAQSSWRT